MLDIRPCTPTIGADVHGVDLADCDRDSFDAITKAWQDWKVLFFRDQDITTEDQLAFCRRFGELERHPFAPPKPGCPEVLLVLANEQRKGNENTWHSDVTWREEPSLGSMLRAIEVPPVGGDTLFADMEAAYESLDEDTRLRLVGLSAEHDLTAVAATLMGEEAAQSLRDTFPPQIHPVVRTHPDTGRMSLYVNAAFTTRIVGLAEDESAALLERLYRTAAVPEHQCRLRWDAGTIALWDNRCVQHYAASDYWPQFRLLERVTVVGDRPR